MWTPRTPAPLVSIGKAVCGLPRRDPGTLLPLTNGCSWKNPRGGPIRVRLLGYQMKLPSTWWGGGGFIRSAGAHPFVLLFFPLKFAVLRLRQIFFIKLGPWDSFQFRGRGTLEGTPRRYSPRSTAPNPCGAPPGNVDLGPPASAWKAGWKVFLVENFAPFAVTVNLCQGGVKTRIVRVATVLVASRSVFAVYCSCIF